MESDIPKKIDANLRRQNEELYETIHTLETALLSISHDLRNPLHIIMMDSAYLLEKCSNQFGLRERSSLERVNSAAQRMVGMVDSLLGMCRLAGQKLSWSRVDLSSMVRAVITDFKRNDPQRQVVSTIQEGIFGWGDPTLLNIVLINLISNSWKYSVDRSMAAIEFGTVPSDGQITCFVRDNGAGFDAQYAERLFLPFQRFHDDFEGSGIGLASVQRIITRMGGRVWAEGAIEKGACVYFTLPASP
jgi:signal transduction histidine kinase